MQTTTQGTRIQGIDLLKCIAILCIPVQHFFTLQTNFRKAEFDTLSLFLQSITMEFAFIGVPLFIAITGYLNKQTIPTFNYYKNSLKVLVPYILISVLYLFFRNYYLNEEISFRHGIGMILRFNAIPYAWYIEMWIGLYLLAPFLNIITEAINKRGHSLVLITTLYFMGYLPITLNRDGFYLLPAYWAAIAPLTCYFIGSHIRKYGSNVSKRNLIIFISFSFTIEPIVNILFFHGQPYRFIFGQYLFIIPAMAAVFSLLYQRNIKKKHFFTIMKFVSNQTLEMYLYCALCDMLLYPFFMRWYNTQSQFGLFFFIIIPLELIIIFLLAWVTRFTIHVLRIDSIWISHQK